MTTPQPAEGTDTASIASEMLAVARDLLGATPETAAELLRNLPRRVLGSGSMEWSRETTDDDTVALTVTVREGGRTAGILRLHDAPDSPAAQALLEACANVLGAVFERDRRDGEERALIAQLKRDSLYFEQLFASSPEAIVVLDESDRVVRANRAFEQLFGYTRDDMVGRTINDLIVPHHLREEAMGLTRSVAAGEVVEQESIRRRKDGSLLHVSILGAPIVDQGNQLGVYGIYRDITAQKETEEALRRLSTTDDLTGLFNRRGFFLLAEQQRRLAIRKGAELLLLYIDIDDFKIVNDNFGHLVGDQVLAELGHILRRCYRDSDILARMGDEPGLLARMGGDEFVILAVDAGTEGEQILTARLRERLREYNATSGRPIRISLSVGAVRVGPDPDRTIDSLLAEADRLMYVDKRDRLRL